jgi:hypothetical protein
MFRSLFHDHPQGSSFVLSAPTTYQPLASSFVFFGFVAVCPLFVCVSGVAVCVLSGRELFVIACGSCARAATTRNKRQFTTRQNTDSYTGHTNRGHTATNPKKTNVEASG